MVVTQELQQRAINRVCDSLDEALGLLEKIRYQNWPTQGLGIDLEPHEIDEILIEGELALNNVSRKKMWKKEVTI